LIYNTHAILLLNNSDSPKFDKYDHIQIYIATNSNDHRRSWIKDSGSDIQVKLKKFEYRAKYRLLFQ